MFRTRTRDDRGDPVLAHHLWLGPPLDGGARTEGGDGRGRAGVGAWSRARAAAHAVTHALFRGPVGRVLVLAAAAAGLVKLVLYFGPFALVFAMFSVVNTTLILGVVTLSVSIAASWRSQGRFTRGRMLADGVCPGCVYPLEDLEPEEDGLIVCPECGGAWDPSPGETRRVVMADPGAAGRTATAIGGGDAGPRGADAESVGP